MTCSAMLVLGWLSLAPAQPEIAPPPPAPVPSPVAGQPATPVPTPAPAPPASAAPAAKVPVFAFNLGPRGECIAPYRHGDAKASDGKAELTAEDNQMKAVVTGAAGANVFLGAESTATLSVQVVQEFEVTCSDPAITQVVLTMESSLAGFIRSKHKASACMSLASATVTPAGSSTPVLSVSYPTACVGGPQGCNGGPQGFKYETPAEPASTGVMPLGRYVLQANFIIETTAGGILDAHSTAIFVPESEDLDAWEREHDPFVGDAHDDFGFSIVVKADSPPGFPRVTHKKPARKVASRTR